MAKIEYRKHPSSVKEYKSGSAWKVGSSGTNNSYDVYVYNSRCFICNNIITKTSEKVTWYNERGYCNSCGMDILGIRIDQIEIVI